MSEEDFSFQTGKAPGRRMMAKEGAELISASLTHVATQDERHYKSGNRLIFEPPLLIVIATYFLSLCQPVGGLIPTILNATEFSLT